MNTLTDLLSSRVKAEVLRLLFGLTARELHVRELERQSGLSVSTVRQELRRLAGLGLIVARKDGNRTYYQANREHPIYPDIRNLVLKTSGLVEILRQALHDTDVRVAFVFGSLASCAEQAHSDVDLMILSSVGLRKVGPLLTDAAELLGREVNPHIMNPDEFARKRAAGDHFITSVLNSPRLFVLGNDDDLAAMGG
ncbi:MAG: ArsR family transcriptional regulator [Planctomycetes bacterium]|nr:ArsR family transcriptional regulator [Planctomycetota bacterium]